MHRIYTLMGPSPSLDQLNAARTVAARQLLEQWDPGCQVFLVTDRPREDRSLADREHLTLLPVSRLRLIHWGWTTMAFGALRLLGLPHRWILPRSLEPFLTAQSNLHLGGVGDSKALSAYLSLFLLSLTTLVDRAPLVLGQERLVRSWIRPWAKMLLKRALVVVSRSPGEMKALELELVGRFLPRRQDLALSLKDGENPLPRQELPPRFLEEGYVALVPNSVQGADAGKGLRDFVQELTEKRSANVVLLAASPSDQSLCEAIYQSRNRHSRIRVMNYRVSPQTFRRLIQGAKYLVTGKEVGWFHGLATLTPTIVFHPTSLLKEQLTELGLPQWGCSRTSGLLPLVRELERTQNKIRLHLKERQPLLLQSSENNIQWALDPVEERHGKPFFRSALTWEEQ